MMLNSEAENKHYLPHFRKYCFHKSGCFVCTFYSCLALCDDDLHDNFNRCSFLFTFARVGYRVLLTVSGIMFNFVGNE